MSALSIRSMNQTIGQRELETETSATPERIAVIREEIAEHHQRDLAQYWAKQMAADFDSFFSAIETTYNDPRTGEQADIDRWQNEAETTRRSDYPI